jgi:hypothetical protein
VRTTVTFALLLVSAVTSAGCKGDEVRPVTEEHAVVFRSADGRTLTLGELQGATGAFRLKSSAMRASPPKQRHCTSRRVKPVGGVSTKTRSPFWPRHRNSHRSGLIPSTTRPILTC